MPVELIELRDPYDDIVMLAARWHVDKAAFRDDCTEWLCEYGYSNSRPCDDQHETDVELLAAPELDAIEWVQADSGPDDGEWEDDEDFDRLYYWDTARSMAWFCVGDTGEEWTVWDMAAAVDRWRESHGN